MALSFSFKHECTEQVNQMAEESKLFATSLASEREGEKEEENME